MRFNFFRRSKIPRQIDLNDLARAFWQDRPEDGACPKDHEHIDSESQPDWVNPDIRDFWLQYVTPFKGTMALPVYETIRNLLSEVEKMETCPSVSEEDEETPRQYRVLSDISLIAHTLNVSRAAVDVLRAKENDFQMNVGKVLIAALGHDMGKHPSAFIPNMPHSYKSAMWLQQRIGHLRDRAQIIEAVRLHHSDNGPRKNNSGNMILPILIQADLNARQKELANTNAKMQKENTDPAESGHSSTDEKSKRPEPIEEKDNSWFSKESFLEHLQSTITCMGFDSFCFDNDVYVTPSIVESALNAIRQHHKLPDIQSKSEIQNILSLHMPEVRNEKRRLRFKDNIKPMKKWFFIFEASLFRDLGEIAQNNPRDRDGRWLKNIDRI